MMDGGESGEVGRVLSCRNELTAYKQDTPHLLVAPDRDKCVDRHIHPIGHFFSALIFVGINLFTARFMQGCKRDNPCICRANVRQ
jgi:hypothetical protein